MNCRFRLPLAASLAAAALIVGCGPAASSSGTRTAAAPPPMVERSGSGYYFRLANDGGPAIAEFKEPVEQLWPALRQAYENAGVEVGTYDPSTYTVGNRSISVTRRLGPTPVSQIVRCASGGFGVSAATTYRIQMSVITTLYPKSDGGTRMETSLDATGTPAEGASRATIVCPSTGNLEKRLADSLKMSAGI